MSGLPDDGYARLRSRLTDGRECFRLGSQGPEQEGSDVPEAEQDFNAELRLFGEVQEHPAQTHVL